jgi:hypothetical protein
MGRRLADPVPGTNRFSPCTIEWWRLQFDPSQHNYNTYAYPACLERRESTASSGAVCGDGLVQGDEECDCAGGNCANDPCCDGATCRFKPQATCAAHQPCCNLNTCSPQRAGVTCRASKGQCDIAETCDGSSVTCPADVRKAVGTPCSSTNNGDRIDGTCTCNDCLTLSKQCQNSAHDFTGVCSWLSTGNSACDVVWCQNSSGKCSGFNQPTPMGISCGAGKACFNKKCVPVAQVHCPGVITQSS